MSETYVTAPPVAAPATGTVRRVSWGAIIAGSVVSVALMILFTTFGIGIGAAIVDPLYDRNPVEGVGIGSGIYMVITQLIALGVGGYVAARLAGIPRPITSVLHGAAVWSVATIFLAWAAVTGGGMIFGATSSIISGTVNAAANVGEAVVPDDLSMPNIGEIAGSISLDALPQDVQDRLAEAGITEANIREEATIAFRNVFSQQEQQAAMSEARDTLNDILRSPGDAGADIAAFFDRLVEGPNAIISDEDRQEAIAVMERRLGVTPEDAQQIVQSVEDGALTALDEAEAAVEAVQTQTVEAAQAASDALSAAALLLSLASILGLAAAAGGAFAGKPNSLIGDRLDDHV
ncbi:hypothetical protein [Jannaschia helgolandensis]|uniref:hypothetical protein n=2 Tax=Jannaschia helgolandensis TaxID=188906 RepID=UPI0030D95D51|tara:strand:- start:4347 stop:5390 length:1044 start_codon:yes stop_codon:yes gene_type:complete